MGKTVIAEETVSDYISSLYGTRSWQAGLIIGQLTSQKLFIVHLARTPEKSSTPDEEAPSKKPSSLEDIDDTWFVEHSRQVSRMLVGGLDVIGVFVFGPPDSLSKIQTKIRQLSYSIYKATYLKYSAFFDPDDLIHSRIVLQICSKTKKITCKTLDVSDIKSTAQPADYKYQSFTNKWNTLESNLNLKYEFSIPRKMEKADLDVKITEGLQCYLEDISNSICTFNSKLLPEDQLLVPTEKHSKSQQSSMNMNVDIYLHKPYAEESKKPKKTESIGLVDFLGTYQCKACLNQKITVREAIQAIKYDAIRSLISRFELLYDDILDQQSTEKPEESASENIWVCPRRVFVPVSKGPVHFCDYLFQDETIQDSIDRLTELLDINPEHDDVYSQETTPTSQSLQEMRNDSNACEEVDNTLDSHPTSTTISGRVIGAVVGLLTAIAATGLAFIWGDQT